MARLLSEWCAVFLSRQLGLGEGSLFRRARRQLHDDVVAHGRVRAARPRGADFLRDHSRERSEAQREQGEVRLHDLRRTHPVVPRHDLHRHAACLRRPLVRERRDGSLRPHRPEQGLRQGAARFGRGGRGGEDAEGSVGDLERGLAERPGVRERRGLQERRLASAGDVVGLHDAPESEGEPELPRQAHIARFPGRRPEPEPRAGPA